MTDLIYFLLASALFLVLVTCAVAFGVVQHRISSKAAIERREHLKARARAL